MVLFLQEADLLADNFAAGEAGLFGALFAFLIGILIFVVVIAIALYIYTSLAFMKIAKKTGTEPAWLAWIPIANSYLISKIAKMQWWPILLLIGFWIPFLNIILLIAFIVFTYIWMWKVFEAVGKPGWWVLLSLIPFVGPVIYLVLLGIAAWGK